MSIASNYAQRLSEVQARVDSVSHERTMILSQVPRFKNPSVVADIDADGKVRIASPHSLDGETACALATWILEVYGERKGGLVTLEEQSPHSGTVGAPQPASE